MSGASGLPRPGALLRSHYANIASQSGTHDSVEKSHAARFEFVDRADELEAAVGRLPASFERSKDLPHGPAYIGLDGLDDHCFRGELRVERLKPRNNAIHEKLDARKLAGSVQARLEGR